MWCFWVLENWVKNYEFKSGICVLMCYKGSLELYYPWVKFIQWFWEEWDQKWDFGWFLGGFPRGKTHFLGSQKRRARRCELCRTTLAILCVSVLWGCFRTSMSTPYVMFWCCFDELKLCNHACLKWNGFLGFETNFD
jgi:hypothetical protein